jgi:hypothetical protein
MNQRFKVSVELSIHSGSTNSIIKERFVQGLTDMNFYDLKFESFERISFTKKEAIEQITNLCWKDDNEDFKNRIAEIINRIS